jgi:predicted MPP superfamily phosphohydrolase
MIIYIPKIVYGFFHFFNFTIKKLLVKETNIFRYIGLVISTISLILILYGGFITPTNFQLRKVVVEIQGLPAAFNGYKIIQFSDFHIGNWNQNYDIMTPITKIINDQHADMIVFTGDMVNNFSDEALGWEPYFKKLKSKNGNYAVLGNHDYGD